MVTKAPAGSLLLNPELILREVELEADERVADFGCGSGYFSLQAARMVGGKGKVFAVDILKSALSSLESKALLYGLDNVAAVWSNVEVYRGAPTIHDHSVNLVTLVQIFSQSSKRHDIFREVDRVLKPDGRVLIIDWKDDAQRFGLKREAHVTVDEIKDVADHAGFKFVKTIEVGPYHFGLLFRKQA